MKRIIPVLIILGLVSACAVLPEAPEEDLLRAAVLSYGDSVAAENAFDGLSASMAATLTVDRLDASADNTFSDYNILYIDGSVLNSGLDKQRIQDYVSAGGSVFLDNSLYDFFDRDFIGAEDFVTLDACPVGMEYPSVENDLQRLQELIWDFDSLYRSYADYDVLSGQNYGVGMIPSSATAVASKNGVGVYTLNEYGGGYVFFTNPLLPNGFSVNNLSEKDTGEPLAMTTVGANRLIRDFFAEFVSLKKYGYAVENVLGSFASPAAARQLYIDDFNAIEGGVFDDLNSVYKRYGQIPSIALSRTLCHTGRRAESVTYALNNGGKFSTDPYEGAYNSGTHFVSDGEWLTLGFDDGTGGYYDYNPDWTKRAYPCPVDWNGDGIMDLICGAADGQLYFYEGIGMGKNYELGGAEILTDTDGNPLSVGSFSSPAAADIDNDGVPEIITGDETGNIHCFKQTEGLRFEDQGVINETGLTDSMPALGDLDGDGVLDMAVGSRNGELRVYYGDVGIYSVLFDKYVTVDTGQSRCAPCIADADGDGVSELYAGTGEGYIAKFENNVFNGYIEGSECNYLGNTNIKFGENCVPRFYDINGDGMQDLIVGSLEYGSAVPVDSPYFPYQSELKTLLDTFKKQDIYVGARMMSNEHADPFHEEREAQYHKNAFGAYKIGWTGIGASQRTGDTSKVGYDTHYDNSAGYNGTYAAQYNSGLLWNSGSRPPLSGVAVGTGAENTIVLPMYLKNGTFLLEPCNMPHGNSMYANITAKYGLPLIFADSVGENAESVERSDGLVRDFGYSFVREDQLVKMAAAALNTRVYAKKTDNTITLSRSVRNKELPLYNRSYQDAVGVKILLSDGDIAEEYSVDADVYYKKDNNIFLSLCRAAEVSKDGASSDLHITSVNLPAKIAKTDKTATVRFLDGGVMTVTTDGSAKTDSEGWEVTQQDGATTFRKYGKASTLRIVK